MFESPLADHQDATACADELAGLVMQQRHVDARRLALAAHWADLHYVDRPVDGRGRSGGRMEYPVPVGADGTPEVGEFAAVELGMLLQTTTSSARALMRDALNLRHRHPRAWGAVLGGEVDAWKARKAAQAAAAAELTLSEAAWVDAETIDALVGLPFQRARRTAEQQRAYLSVGRRSNEFGMRTLITQNSAGAIARIEAMTCYIAELLATQGDNDPADTRRAKALAILANPALACVMLANARTESDDRAETEETTPSAVELAVTFGAMLNRRGLKAIDRLRPKTVMHLHLSQTILETLDHKKPVQGQVVRTEGLGAISIKQLTEWLHAGAGVDRVIVHPVLDPATVPPVDAYEAPRRMRESLDELYPYEVFPYGTLASRSADDDHTVPYLPPDEGGPPGQTRLDNLGPLGRHHHRAKTLGGFTLHQPLPGMYLWRTPTGHWFQVDNQGTHPLGKQIPDVLMQGAEPATRVGNVFLQSINVPVSVELVA